MQQKTLTQEEKLNFNLVNPVILCENTTLTDYYRKGDPYQLFQSPGSSKAIVKFMVPPSVRGYSQGHIYMHLNHCRTTADGIVNMTLNGRSYRSQYTDAPRYNFGVQTFSIPYSLLNMEEPNIFEIELNPNSRGYYWLSDISFSFENQRQCLKYAESYHIDRNITGATYHNVDVTDDYRKGNPYLLFNKQSSSCTIEIFTPKSFYELSKGMLTISLNHCRTSGNGIINMTINGKTYRSRYADAPQSNFGIQNFEIPFSSLNLDGQPNKFEISLYTSESKYGYYWLSDVQLGFEATLPEVTKPNYEKYVKNWILLNRKNIVELNQIPRDDLSTWEFIKNAPSWFYLPFLPISPTELAVLISHFPSTFLKVGWGVKAINQQARDFHSELLVTDIPRKNALRHAYWMALVTREYGDQFADALGNAHEYAHVDLTIEGPYDHVTDKINNAVGIELAKKDKTTDCAILVDNAWRNNELAWAKNFRIEGESQTADIFWQEPLNKLAKNYNVIPDFNVWELSTLKKHNITIPSKPPIHDEL